MKGRHCASLLFFRRNFKSCLDVTLDCVSPTWLSYRDKNSQQFEKLTNTDFRLWQFFLFPRIEFVFKDRNCIVRGYCEFLPRPLRSMVGNWSR